MVEVCVTNGVVYTVDSTYETFTKQMSRHGIVEAFLNSGEKIAFITDNICTVRKV